MRWSSLDSIIKGLLIKQGKPIHWYMQYLKYACDAVRDGLMGAERYKCSQHDYFRDWHLKNNYCQPCTAEKIKVRMFNLDPVRNSFKKVRCQTIDYKTR